MNKILCTLAVLVLSLTGSSPAADLKNFPSQDTVGTWTFFIKLADGPPCQCVQIGRLHADGTFDGPANDHQAGEAVGMWQQTGLREVTFAILQSSIKPDGSAGGEYVIHAKISLNAASDQGTGSGTMQLVDNGGNAISSGSFTIKAVKLKL